MDNQKSIRPESIPVTFCCAYKGLEPRFRQGLFQEFAACGAKHLVLTDSLIEMILSQPALAQDLRHELAATGLDFVDSHAPFSPFVDLSCPLPERFRENVLRHKLHLNLAAAFNVKTMTIHSGNDHRFPEVPKQVFLDRTCAMLDELLPEAEKCDVVICIENIWFRINTPDWLNGIKRRYPTPYLGFCYDSGHANIMARGREFPEGEAIRGWGAVGETPVWEDHALEKMLPDVVNCHLHDNFGENDLHANLGLGNVDWPHVAGLLKQAPRLQCIQSEVKLPAVNYSLRQVVESFDRFRKLL